MFSKSAKAIFEAMRLLFRNWRAMTLMAAVYVALLATIYFFISTREATVTQLIITLSLAVAAPILFFILQAASASYTTGARTSFLLKTSARGFWKLFIISLPVIALTIMAVYLLDKAQAHVAIGSLAPRSELPNQSPATLSSIQWKLTALIAVRYLLLGAVVPLLLIQFWITVSNQGLAWLLAWRSMATRLREIAVKALAPESCLIYAVGFLVFGVLPYVGLFRAISSKHAWVEVTLLGFRIVVSAGLVLIGWITTVGALSISTAKLQESLSAEGS